MDLHSPHRHHRRSTRLLGYDYSAAASYFVTLCTEGRELLFGRVIQGAMEANDLGAVVDEVRERTPEVRPTLRMDVVVVMPNHLHGIVTFRDPKDDGQRDALPTERAHSCGPDTGGRGRWDRSSPDSKRRPPGGSTTSALLRRRRSSSATTTTTSSATTTTTPASPTTTC